MPNKNITFNFDSSIDSKTKLQKEIFDAYRKNKEFFGKDIPNIKIDFLYQRIQLNAISGRKTQDWEVGYAHTKDNSKQIVIFSPTVFDKVSNHPASDFSFTLTHEIAHIFINEILGFYYPRWLNEGIAGYAAKQYKIRKVKKVDSFNDLHDSKNWNKLNNYAQAFSFTKYLIDTLGRDKLIKFMSKLSKTLGRHHLPENFTKFFNEFFKNDFNELVIQWKKTLK